MSQQNLTPDLSSNEIQECLKFVRGAGDLLLRHFHDKSFFIEYKEYKHPVTQADFDSNDHIIGAINRLFPDDALLSEEITSVYTRKRMESERIGAHRLWVIDPLDGTREFIHGVPNFSLSVALLVDSKPEFGIIYNPAEDFMIYGGKPYGIFINDEMFTPEPSAVAEDIAELNISISNSESKSGVFRDLSMKIPQNNIHIIGSIAYKLGLLGAQKTDLVLSRKPKSIWDIAGGACILEAAGIDFLDKDAKPIILNGETILVNGIIAGAAGYIEIYRKYLESLRTL